MAGRGGRGGGEGGPPVQLALLHTLRFQADGGGVEGVPRIQVGRQKTCRTNRQRKPLPAQGGRAAVAAPAASAAAGSAPLPRGRSPGHCCFLSATGRGHSGFPWGCGAAADASLWGQGAAVDTSRGGRGVATAASLRDRVRPLPLSSGGRSAGRCRFPRGTERRPLPLLLGTGSGR